MRRRRLTMAAVCAIVLVTTAGRAAGTPQEAETPASAPQGLLCARLPISREAVDAPVPLSGLDQEARTALSEAVWDDGLPLELSEDDWYVATVTDDSVSVIRDVEVAPDPVSSRIPPDHEIVTVSWVGDASNIPPGWYVTLSGPCALTLDLGELSVPAIEFASPPDPESIRLDLLVTEQTCNSGQDARGRVEIVSVEETDEQVSLVLGVQAREGAHTCPAHPATPFTVTLSTPLGERDVVDGGLAAPRSLSLPD